MALNVKTIEMVAKIKSKQTRMHCSHLPRTDFLFTNYIPTMKDCLRDLYIYLKKAQKELDEKNRNYKLI